MNHKLQIADLETYVRKRLDELDTIKAFYESLKFDTEEKVNYYINVFGCCKEQTTGFEEVFVVGDTPIDYSKLLPPIHATERVIDTNGKAHVVPWSSKSEEIEMPSRNDTTYYLLREGYCPTVDRPAQNAKIEYFYHNQRYPAHSIVFEPTCEYNRSTWYDFYGKNQCGLVAARFPDSRLMGHIHVAPHNLETHGYEAEKNIDGEANELLDETLVDTSDANMHTVILEETINIFDNSNVDETSEMPSVFSSLKTEQHDTQKPLVSLPPAKRSEKAAKASDTAYQKFLKLAKQVGPMPKPTTVDEKFLPKTGLILSNLRKVIDGETPSLDTSECEKPIELNLKDQQVEAGPSGSTSVTGNTEHVAQPVTNIAISKRRAKQWRKKEMKRSEQENKAEQVEKRPQMSKKQQAVENQKRKEIRRVIKRLLLTAVERVHNCDELIEKYSVAVFLELFEEYRQTRALPDGRTDKLANILDLIVEKIDRMNKYRMFLIEQKSGGVMDESYWRHFNFMLISIYLFVNEDREVDEESTKKASKLEQKADKYIIDNAVSYQNIVSLARLYSLKAVLYHQQNPNMVEGQDLSWIAYHTNQQLLLPEFLQLCIVTHFNPRKSPSTKDERNHEALFLEELLNHLKTDVSYGLVNLHL